MPANEENYSDDNDWYSDVESNGNEYVEVNYNNILSDDEEENQNYKSDDEVIPNVNIEYEKNCFYCRKTFKEITLYDSHYSGCYDRYAYMHMWFNKSSNFSEIILGCSCTK